MRRSTHGSGLRRPRRAADILSVPPPPFSPQHAAAAAADISRAAPSAIYLFAHIYTFVHECLAKPASRYGDTKNSHAARPRPGSPCISLSNVAVS